MKYKVISIIPIFVILSILSMSSVGIASDVPFFSQRDLQWADDYMGSSGCTIEDCGCVMVDTAMLLKFYGVDTDPGILNTWLSNNNGYTSDGELYWNKPAEYSNGKMEYIDSLAWTSPPPYSDNDHWSDLSAQVVQGYPVIVKVDAYLSTPELEPHWILVNSFTGGNIDNPNNYYINDPYDISYNPDKRLSYYYDSVYDNTFFAIRVYHGIAATVPEPPILLSPGSGTEPGPVIDTIIPTLQWQESVDADYYAIAISEYPYGPSNMVYNPQQVYGSSHAVPSDKLEEGKKYRWNMQAHNSIGWSNISNTLYFQTNTITVPEPPILLSPGTEAEPGTEIETLTPTLEWEDSVGADYYAIAISEYPYGAGNIVYNPQQVYGSSHAVPSDKLEDGKKYRWNMQAHNSDGWSTVSDTLYFHISIEPPVNVKGIDVSSHQGNIDWTQVYNAGYKFAFARASMGDENPPLLVDEYFVTNMENGHDAGLLMGAYHFAYPEYTDPVSEAQHFLDVAGDYLTEGYLRPVLDLEDDPSSDSYPYRLGSTVLSGWVNDWVNTVVNQTGIEPIIYVNSNYANNYLDSSISNYDLWIADWTYDPYVSPGTGIWNDWDFWQYSDLGAVPGISTNVDLDLFNGNTLLLENFIISFQSTNWRYPSATGVMWNQWNNPTYAFLSDDNYALTTGFMQYQDYGGFELSIPEGSIINGIEVKVECHSTGTQTITCILTPGSSRYDFVSINNDNIVIMGGPSDDWGGGPGGQNWAPSDFSNASFRPYFYEGPYGSAVYVDEIQIKVYYTKVTLKGDINSDGKVDLQDFSILGAQWFDAPSEMSADIAPEGGDGIVDFLDLSIISQHWLDGTTP